MHISCGALEVNVTEVSKLARAERLHEFIDQIAPCIRCSTKRCMRLSERWAWAWHGVRTIGVHNVRTAQSAIHALVRDEHATRQPQARTIRAAQPLQKRNHGVRVRNRRVAVKQDDVHHLWANTPAT